MSNTSVPFSLPFKTTESCSTHQSVFPAFLKSPSWATGFHLRDPSLSQNGSQDLQSCPPTNIGQLRPFLGILNFYRRFLPNAASHQAPLHDVLSGAKLKDSHPITWTAALDKTFEECKNSLPQGTLLAHPDSTSTFALVTDASTTAIGAVF